MPTPHKHAALIKAWADGAEIELFRTPTATWESCTAPAWDADTQYRIKPPPPQDEAVSCARPGAHFRITFPQGDIGGLVCMTVTGDRIVCLTSNRHYQVGDVLNSIGLRGKRVSVSFAITERQP